MTSEPVDFSAQHVVIFQGNTVLTEDGVVILARGWLFLYHRHWLMAQFPLQVVSVHLPPWSHGVACAVQAGYTPYTFHFVRETARVWISFFGMPLTETTASVPAVDFQNAVSACKTRPPAQ